MQEAFDLFIIGGGINGTGIARDAAGRGLSAFVCEQSDLAEFTSSASTKLIHGGLRYLEYYDFRLVREALMERERVLAIAPHIVGPLRFVLPHNGGLRPAWMIRIGLFLYDHLARRKVIPGSEGIRLRKSPIGEPLQDWLDKGFLYSDCWVDDARLVVLNAMDAKERGATIETRTRFISGKRENGLWHAIVEDVETGEQREIRARIMINTAGPWVSHVLHERLHLETAKHVRLVKGSHFIVPKLYEGEHAFIFQNPDNRIVFAIPYQDKFTLVGTTDEPYKGAPGKVEISAAETSYLCDSINRYFKQAITPKDVVWAFSGVRPLYDDAAANASAVTRDYVLDVDAPDGAAPLMSVFGGKITTFRRLAEHAIEKLAPHLPGLKPTWTATKALPGGDLPNMDFEAFLKTVQARWPFLPEKLARRLAHAYGTRIDVLMGEAKNLADLGQDFGGGLTRAEADYLVVHEWARTSEDILWRRSKLGLHVQPGTVEALTEYLRTQSAKRPAAKASKNKKTEAVPA